MFNTFYGPLCTEYRRWLNVWMIQKLGSVKAGDCLGRYEHTESNGRPAGDYRFSLQQTTLEDQTSRGTTLHCQDSSDRDLVKTRYFNTSLSHD